MEYVNCNFCQNNNTKLLFLQKDKFKITNDEFNIVRCQNCGLIYVNPRPTQEEIIKFYPDTYSWKETLVANSFFIKIIRKLEKFYRDHLLRYEVNKTIKSIRKKKGKVLDLGCGAGDRLNLFRKYGFDSYGTDITDMADYAKDFFGLNVIKKDLLEANLPDDFFDIITMQNVIEHVSNPQNIIKECYRILKKNGFLVIQTPNINCLQFKFLKNKWTVIDPPRHLYYFSDLILKKELEKNKFKVTNID
ncbi:MAG: class I SAM-dependent methyltransferase, partial [Candidatus Omnitrophota bacterium]